MNFPTDKELDEIERYMQEEKLLTPVTTSEAKRLIAAARDRNRLERGYLSDDSCPRCAPLAAENRAFHEDRRLTAELAEAHRRLTTELAEARARLIPEEERRKLEGDILTAESASAELRDQLERVQRELGKARADLFARGALIESLTKERDEAVRHDRAIEEMLTGVQAENRLLRAERDEARDGYHALDRNWETMHNAAMKPIREALGLPDGTVLELCAEINQLHRSSAKHG